jgi:hypothetical protein
MPPLFSSAGLRAECGAIAAGRCAIRRSDVKKLDNLGVDHLLSAESYHLSCNGGDSQDDTAPKR